MFVTSYEKFRVYGSSTQNTRRMGSIGVLQIGQPFGMSEITSAQL